MHTSIVPYHAFVRRKPISGEFLCLCIRHQHPRHLRNEAVCPVCQDEEETSIHFIAQCSATMLLRRPILGDYTLSLDTLNGIHWTVLLRFAKAYRRFFSTMRSVGVAHWAQTEASALVCLVHQPRR